MAFSCIEADGTMFACTQIKLMSIMTIAIAIVSSSAAVCLYEHHANTQNTISSNIDMKSILTPFINIRQVGSTSWN